MSQPVLEISDELSFLKDHYDFFSLPLLYLQDHVDANNIFSSKDIPNFLSGGGFTEGNPVPAVF